MKSLHHSLSLATVLLACVALLGCGDQQTATPPASNNAAGDDHGHAHNPDGSHPEEAGGHSHGAAPHDGTIADWGGGKFHVEFTVDHDKQQATVYLLGDDAQTAAPAGVTDMQLTIKDPELQTALTPSPLDGETAENCSRYVGTHEGLGVVQEYAGTISGVIDGTPYAGNFEEVAHGHDHGHEH